MGAHATAFALFTFSPFADHQSFQSQAVAIKHETDQPLTRTLLSVFAEWLQSERDLLAEGELRFDWRRISAHDPRDIVAQAVAIELEEELDWANEFRSEEDGDSLFVVSPSRSHKRRH